MNKFFKIFFIIIIFFGFLFIRLYNIKDGFFFFNDVGRDSLVLYDWLKTGKPPLLGPQTSALPINQSPFYFYWLMIFYFFLKGYYLYHVIALLSFYLIIFFIGLFLFRKNNLFIKIWLGSYFLMMIHPQYIIQSRYVWNPSFTSPLILLSLILFYQSIFEKNKNYLFLSSVFLSLAISFSYSIIPLFLVLSIFLLIYQREYFLNFILFFFLSLIFFYLPVIVFELRHNFLLTNSLFFKSHPKQQSLDFMSKLNSLSNYVFATNNFLINKILFGFIFIYSLYLCFLNRKNIKENFFYFVFLFLIILTFIIPITVQAHYIFGLTSLLFIIIFFKKRIFELFFLLLLTLFYSLGLINSNYFKSASRTYNQINSCFNKFCQSFKKPIYTTVVSNFHPYHYGPEHRYLLKKNGCNIFNIEEDQNKTNLMMVVLDDGFFDEKTKYYELELFGKFKIIKKYFCQNNFGYLILEKQ
jgi:hypothetical protein